MIEPDAVRAALADVHRREWAAVLTATMRVAGSLDLAEECAQEAFVRALETWPRDGLPRNPAAWLTTTAKRRALDAHRRDTTLRGKLPLLFEPDEGTSAAGLLDPAEDTPMNWSHFEPEPSFGGARSIPDDRLRLVFTCCHPALAREAQVALTLRLVCGLSTPDIASAFLVSEATMAARVTRAKKKIAAARIPYRIPALAELPERLDAVLTVLHLVFTTGHLAPSGTELHRPELAERAIDCGRLLLALMPDEREVAGLLALMLLTDARRLSRTDSAGRLVLLAEQDRLRWDAGKIDEGRQLVVRSLRGGRPGRFALQAAIAALHAESPSAASTDWSQIVGLYDLLLQAWPSPVVALNRAVAVAERDGPLAGLAALDELDRRDGTSLSSYHYLPSARAELWRRLGRRDQAAQCYRVALELVDNEAERVFLAERLAEVTGE
ncbi:MAG: polymerase sigma factor [Frankiales bacterium]|nr:polymerase sigma factor [Frankiales bacterium]